MNPTALEQAINLVFSDRLNVRIARIPKMKVIPQNNASLLDYANHLVGNLLSQILIQNGRKHCRL
jgi:hypothetical protein